DQALDELPLGDGLRRVAGDLQRHLAEHAHDLVLEVVEGCAGLRRRRSGHGGRAGARGDEREEREDGESPAPDHAVAAFAIALATKLSSTGPRLRSTMRPWRSSTNVSGTPCRPSLDANEPSTSRSTGYVSPCARTNRSASGTVSRHVTPTTTAPFEVIRLYARSSAGASVLHGAHHEANTFTITIFPR